MNQFLLIGVIVTALFATACTRGKGNGSAFQLKVPSVDEINKNSKALTAQAVTIPAGYKLTHIFVKLTDINKAPVLDGNGNQIQFVWDCDLDDGCEEPAPATITFDKLESSKYYLIQYLGAYEDALGDSDGIVITYGDFGGSFVPNNNNVTITVAAHGASSTNKEARIAGQYVTGFTNGLPTGPTGPVNIGFNPGNSKPIMHLETEEIFNGYFEFFAIEGVNIVYEHNGKLLSGINTAKIAERLASDDTSLVQINVNKSYISWGGGDTHEVSPRNLYLGYFGTQSLSNFRACYPAYDESSIESNGASIWGNEGLSTEYGYSTIPGATNVAVYRNLGGTPANLAECSSRIEHSTKLSFTLDQLNNGFNQAAPFTGPFARVLHSFTNSNCDMMSDAAGCYDDTLKKATIKAKLLPGVLTSTSVFKGVDVFFKRTTECSDCYEDFRGDDDAYLCASLPSKGFTNSPLTAAQKTSLLSSGTLDHSFTLNLNATDNIGLAILCPYSLSGSTKIYYGSGVGVHNIKFFPSLVLSDPPPVTANLAAWYDAEDMNSMSQTQNCAGPAVTEHNHYVGCWKDKSGNNRHITVDDINYAPTYFSSGSDKDNSVYFLQTNNHALSGDFQAGAFSGGYTAFIVRKHVTGATGGQTYMQLSRTAPAPNEKLFLYRDPSEGSMYHYGDSATPELQGKNTFVPGDDVEDVVSYRYVDATHTSIRVDGASDSGVVHSGTSPLSLNLTGPVRIYIGGTNDNNQIMQGAIREVLFYSATLTEVQESAIICHLRTKWELGACIP